MQPGQFLGNKDGEKIKVIDVSKNDEVVFVSKYEPFKYVNDFRSKSSLVEEGWSLLEEPWVPKGNEMVYIVESTGKISYTPWSAWDEESRNFFLATDNYFRSLSDAELYRQKLKEN